MKKKLCLLLFSFSFLTWSQPYTPLLDTQNEWHFTTCFQGDCLSDIYYTNGDTLVNGLNHKILDGYHYISRTFLLREDVPTKKVFLTKISPNRIDEYLLYDFSLEEGATFEMKNPISPFPTEAGEFVLDSIRQKPIFEGEFRKHFYFSPSESNQISTNTAVWVEGVGSLSLINAPSGFPDQNGVGLLQCFFKDGVLFYADIDAIVPVCTPTLLASQDFTISELKFQFSKSEETLYIKNVFDVNSLEMFDVFGRRNLMIHPKSKEVISIPFHSYSKGFYIFRIQFLDGHYQHYKISY